MVRLQFHSVVLTSNLWRFISKLRTILISGLSDPREVQTSGWHRTRFSITIWWGKSCAGVLPTVASHPHRLSRVPVWGKQDGSFSAPHATLNPPHPPTPPTTSNTNITPLFTSCYKSLRLYTSHHHYEPWFEVRGSRFFPQFPCADFTTNKISPRASKMCGGESQTCRRASLCFSHWHWNVFLFFKFFWRGQEVTQPWATPPPPFLSVCHKWTRSYCWKNKRFFGLSKSEFGDVGIWLINYGNNWKTN